MIPKSKRKGISLIRRKSVRKTRNTQYGGEDTELLLKKMRAYSGEFVLVIGTNYSEKHCLDFANSLENRDKMVITLDLRIAEPTQFNNFKLDFNQIETWNILHEFDDRFRTIIFDIGTEHYIDDNIDYIFHIQKLLIIGGKLYKFINYYLNFPSNIPSHQIIRRITDIDINIIKHQYPDIPPISLNKINQILYIRFTQTPYGLKRGIPQTNSPTYAILNVDTILKEQESTYILRKLEVPLMNWEINETNEMWRLETDSLGRNLDEYMDSLFRFYDQLTESRILQEVYGFQTDFFEECINYPLKYNFKFGPKIRTEDICFVVCTKTDRTHGR
jgi:hypothetical protein